MAPKIVSRTVWVLIEEDGTERIFPERAQAEAVGRADQDARRNPPPPTKKKKAKKRAPR